ncbi:MAG: hypothetical protein ABSE49_28015 [Polyangiaceae bacterium]|jgi:hypothetical protein
MAEAAGATIVRSPVATIIVVPVASAVDPGELLPLVDAGRLAGTSPRALKEAARRGELELFGRERSRVVRRGDVLRWVQERRTPIASVADPQQARVERRLARRSHRAA